MKLLKSENTFSGRLKKLRGEHSQASFSAFLGINQTTLSSWERGSAEPSASKISMICDKLNVSSDWLLGLSTVSPAEALTPQTSIPPPVQHESYWRDLVASQQATIQSQASALAAALKKHPKKV